MIVIKKDGSVRFCCDYRKLNKVTCKDAYPLPRVEESLDALGNAQLFSTLDLTSGYFQVAMSEEDRAKTAVTTPFGLFEWTRMPFGLCNAPATFQRLMGLVLGDLTFDILLNYLDDIIVFSKDFESHCQRLEIVFNRLRQHGLKLNPSKCFLLKPEVKFLGHLIFPTGNKGGWRENSGIGILASAQECQRAEASPWIHELLQEICSWFCSVSPPSSCPGW